MSRLEFFLERLDRAFPGIEAKVAWQMASYQVSQRRCEVMVESVCCNLRKVDGMCPYHKGSKHDFLRLCTYGVDASGRRCYNEVKSRELSVVYCEKHLVPPKPVVRIRRAGDYVVIKETPFAISDDMRFIIGRVESTYLLTYILCKEVDPFMEETASLYGLAIRFEE